jgi:allantoin racemase
MRLLFINPNTTTSMTRSIGVQARAVAAGTTEIVTANPPHGPAAIDPRRRGSRHYGDARDAADP